MTVETQVHKIIWNQVEADYPHLGWFDHAVITRMFVEAHRFGSDSIAVHDQFTVLEKVYQFILQKENIVLWDETSQHWFVNAAKLDRYERLIQWTKQPIPRKAVLTTQTEITIEILDIIKQYVSEIYIGQDWETKSAAANILKMVVKFDGIDHMGHGKWKNLPQSIQREMCRIGRKKGSRFTVWSHVRNELMKRIEEQIS